MHKLELKIPPVVVFAFAVLGLFLCSLVAEGGLSLHEFRTPVMMIFLLLGGIVGVMGVVSFKIAKTTINPMSIDKASQLVTHGIYRFTRNPMYLGLVMILISFSIFFYTNPILSLLVIMIFVVYMNQFQIKPEERILTELFGQPYVDYLLTTRRWI